MKKYSSIFILFFLFVSIPLNAQKNTTSISVGEKEIKLPFPQDFYAVRKNQNELRQMFKDIISKPNRLLALFVSRDDLNKIEKNENPSLNRYIVAGVSKRLENEKISSERFNGLVKIIKRKQESLFEEAETTIDDAINRILIEPNQGIYNLKGVEIEDVMPMGIYSESQNWIGFSSLFKFKKTNLDSEVTFYTVGAMNLIYVKNKAIYVFVYSQVHSREDLEWVKSISKSWVKDIIFANR